MITTIQSPHVRAFVRFCETLDFSHDLEALDAIYTPDVHFADPFIQTDGREAVKRYFRQYDSSFFDLTFEFDEVIEAEERTVLVWQMELRFRRLDTPIRFTGNTILKYREDGIWYHRDYFDTGLFSASGVPVWDSVLGVVKQLLSRALMR